MKIIVSCSPSSFIMLLSVIYACSLRRGSDRNLVQVSGRLNVSIYQPSWANKQQFLKSFEFSCKLWSHCESISWMSESQILTVIFVCLYLSIPTLLVSHVGLSLGSCAFLMFLGCSGLSERTFDWIRTFPRTYKPDCRESHSRSQNGSQSTSQSCCCSEKD